MSKQHRGTVDLRTKCYWVPCIQNWSLELTTPTTERISTIARGNGVSKQVCSAQSKTDEAWLLRTKQWAQNGVTYVELHITRLRQLNYSFSSPRNENLNHSIRNCLISISEVICLIGPFHPAEGK